MSCLHSPFFEVCSGAEKEEGVAAGEPILSSDGAPICGGGWRSGRADRLFVAIDYSFWRPIVLVGF